ncbi:MAG: metallophosphoesterase [Prolixibacteraceae bacterium]|nr:metallophosphoesterase [Prolixibacteraceae bacterium]
MKRNNLRWWGTIVSTLFILAATSCQKDDDPLSLGDNPFDLVNGGEAQDRNKIVVISDLHLGADLTYSECVHHLPRMAEFLTEIRESKTVKELVIGGDMLDEWYVLSRTDTYDGKTQKEFIQKIAAQNKGVIDVLNDIIKDGKIIVTYAPGNHDLLVTKENVDLILPGINQARDNDRLGLGTYNPNPKIAIEHCNRYDFFCAPDPYSNQDIAAGTILPAGYFFTRIAVNSVTNHPAADEIIPVRDVKLNSADENQVNTFVYYSIWKSIMKNFIPVKDNYDDKIIVTNIGNFNGNYSINDIIPFNKEDGSIDMNLYSGFCSQTAWEKRLVYSNVPVMTPVIKAMQGSLKTSFLDSMSYVQYFQNIDSKARIVVFGHTHAPMLKSFTNTNGEACIYANSGTWIDKKIKNNEVVDQDVENMDFIVIAPQATDSSMVKVELFKYHRGKHISIESKSIKL